MLRLKSPVTQSYDSPAIRGLNVLISPSAGRARRPWSAAPGLVLATLVVLLTSALVTSGSEAMATTTSVHATTTSRTGTSPPITSVTSTPHASTTTTRPSSPPKGHQTVLSPVGLHVHSGPAKTDKVIGSAAQGVALLRLGHTTKNGGWYEVSGATVIGWISADPSLSAPGRFGYYSSAAFNVLFPAGWTSSGKPKAGVVFKAPASTEKVVITTATSVAALPKVSRAAGISEASAQQVVACGVSGYLYSYRTRTPHKFYADAAFALGTGHALGLQATLTSLSELTTVLDFVNSISFPLPICVGKPATTH